MNASDLILFSCSDYSIVELHDIDKKKNWMKMYKNDYFGEIGDINNVDYYGNNVRFIVYRRNGLDIGFIRINDKSKFFKDFIPNDVWNLTDGYVKKDYRRQGILACLIEYSVENFNVAMAYMELKVYIKNYKYYENLGYDYFVKSTDGQMAWLFHRRISNVAKIMHASR